MDLTNNRNGIAIAAGLPPGVSDTDQQAAVVSAVNAVTLTILDDRTNDLEVGLLQPSNK